MKIKLNNYQIDAYFKFLEDLEENNKIISKLLAFIQKNGRKMTKLSKEIYPLLPKEIDKNGIVEIEPEIMKKAMEYIDINNSTIKKDLETIAEFNMDAAEELEQKSRYSDLDLIYQLFDFNLELNNKKERSKNCR